MQDGPSRTAHMVAIRRAAHQVLDRPLVFKDPLALAIAGVTAEEILQSELTGPAAQFSKFLRAIMAVRSRFAEDELAHAVHGGVRQSVIVGAGLDTYAYRNRFPHPGLRVFEVDHPATQAWKRERLQQAAIAIPENVVFVPADFETSSLNSALREAGCDPHEPAFFTWLGVTPYLTRSAFDQTIRDIAGWPKGSGVVFDFTVPREMLSGPMLAAYDALAARVASVGEPFQLSFDPAELAATLTRLGFEKINFLDSNEINARYFAHRTDDLYVPEGAARLVSAVKSPR